MDYTLTKLLGGIANGNDVPGDWDLISEWIEPGTGRKSIYDKRHFFQGSDRYTVWVAADVPETDFQAVMYWHREMYRGDIVAVQKDILKESISGAMNYTNLIMVVGYAALAALLSNGKGLFTPVTFFSATIFLAFSAFAFIAWEIYGMVVRSKSGIALASAVNDSETFEAKAKAHQDHMAATMRRLLPLWVTNIALAAGCGLVSFAIMISAYIHAAWRAI